MYKRLGGWCVAGCALLAGCGDDGADTTLPPATTTTTPVDMTTTTPTPTTEAPTSDESSGSSTDPTTTTETPTSTGDESTTTPAGSCGDGNVDDGEECDDGNDVLTDACLPTCVAARCGDAVLWAGMEACDDANDVDTDACVACQDAACGDGFVHAGVEGCDDTNLRPGDGCSADCRLESCGNGTVEGMEACDDGDADDTDLCTSLCAMAACGDGFVHAGEEECDDGNALDTDACVTGCKLATCGDGFVYMDAEECDDMNADETDACTALCATPTCSDDAQNGSETDEDCGGSCPKCGLGGTCAASEDCGAGLCLSGVCAVPKTCQAIKAGAPELPSGAYTIDTDGAGPYTPLQVYCDQDTDGGGWTMVAKFSEGAGGDASNQWSGGPLNDSDATLLTPMKSTKQYVSRIPQSFWNQNGVVVNLVRVHAYSGGTLVKFWEHDGVGSDPNNWFAGGKLVESPYTDLPGALNYYSIAGDPANGRRWFINSNYGGCPADSGWLIVDSAADPCAWETKMNAPAPRILFAPGTTKVTWEAAVNNASVGVAETLAVFIR